MDQSEKPVVASHSDARALCSNTRNLTDEMFRCICATGGFAGLNFYTPFLGLDHSLDAVFAHLEHFLDLGGEKYGALAATGMAVTGCLTVSAVCRTWNGFMRGCSGAITVQN